MFFKTRKNFNVFFYDFKEYLCNGKKLRSNAKIFKIFFIETVRFFKISDASIGNSQKITLMAVSKQVKAEV